MTKAQQVRAKKISRTLKKLFPDAKIALKFKNPWELLVAVILSAQCTDKKVNQVTQTLFKKYQTLDDYLEANIREFARDIRSTGFFNTKARYILETARLVKKNFKGKVPRTMNELLTLRGVACKTANVILSNAFGINEGIAVDTHVIRFSNKLGLTKYHDPNKIEQDLMKLFPKSQWNTITYRFIEYGRQICPARKHDCKNHPLTKLYPRAANIWPKSK